jgi:hypothetical protein
VQAKYDNIAGQLKEAQANVRILSQPIFRNNCLTTMQVALLTDDVKRATTELAHLRQNQETIIKKRCLEQRWQVRVTRGLILDESK